MPKTSPDSLTLSNWQMQPTSIRTRWANSVGPENVWPEYPRPQMVRTGWQSLNGLWEYAFTAMSMSPPAQFEGNILVPYPVESALSGVRKSLQPDQALWYRRTIHIEPTERGDRVLLHFGAVDSEAMIFLNDENVGVHSGGYQSFTLDITDAARAGSNTLLVRVCDATEEGHMAYGKQHLRPNSMFYSASSGIWQTVWIEQVPSTYIESLKLVPDVDRSEISLEVAVCGRLKDCLVEATVLDGERVVSTQLVDGSTGIRIDRPRLWSPDDPHLYNLRIRMLRNSCILDEVSSYFGMRKIALMPDSSGRCRIYLNNRYTYNLGVVDQGFWPDGLYTAPNDEALKFDIQAAKALGFNCIRKHIKIEPDRWYYHCDRLGLMVLQDMPTASNDTPEARLQFEREVRENLLQLRNHPSITTWVIFNEGWGAYEPDRLVKWVKNADPSRLVNGHSGPYDQLDHAQWLKRRDPELLLQPLGGRSWTVDDVQWTQCHALEGWMYGDVADIHIYPGPDMFPARPDKASVAGEYGSFGVYVADHVWSELDPVGAGVGASAMTPQQMLLALKESTKKLKALEAQGLCGSSYFQLVDVEGEQQGFITYDRAMAKVPVTEVAQLNAEIVRQAENYCNVTKGFVLKTAEWLPDVQRLEMLSTAFRNGQAEIPLLISLGMTALRVGDLAQATEACDALISCLPRPYSKDDWESIVAMTHSSCQKSFELLRARSDEVNAFLGDGIAEKKILEIIGREYITPYFMDRNRQIGWSEFERKMAQQYGALGEEAALGAQMMEFLLNKDWGCFGSAYRKYFATAFSTTPYSPHSLSYQVLKHVENTEILESAIDVMRQQISAVRAYPIFGEFDPTELDTLANLLNKVGQKEEAIHWQRRAVVLSDSRDAEILENLRRMTSQQ